MIMTPILQTEKFLIQQIYDESTNSLLWELYKRVNGEWNLFSKTDHETLLMNKIFEATQQGLPFNKIYEEYPEIL